MYNFAANYTTSFLTVKSTPTLFEEGSAWPHHVSSHFTTFSGKKSKGAIGRRDKNFSVEGKVSHCCQVQIDFISFIRRTRTLPLTMHSAGSQLLRDVVKGTPKLSGKSFCDMWRQTDKFTWLFI